MSKWFESANLANYAKTALLQAQKQIDKVLDIKEDEIIGKIQTTTNDNIDFTINDQLTNNKPFTPPPPLTAASTTTTPIENDFNVEFLDSSKTPFLMGFCFSQCYNYRQSGLYILNKYSQNPTLIVTTQFILYSF